ncbi:gastrula zinc finger protein XlCGF57.1 [Labrus bergylta]|uniref:gastrula zinc finger protein XlCGF57.1 n=1 Tax=Labrus bergylta TaxID=56723 RepID=UPI003313A72E
MSKVQILRSFVNQRLSAAAEEIFDLFERTIAEYEEEICRSKENQHKLLDAVYNPEIRLHRAEVQQLLSGEEEVPPEQQERSSSLNQEGPPEPPHIKEEQEELWTHEEGEQLRGPEGADIIKFTFTPVPVKSEENDEEKPQSSERHGNHTEESRDREKQNFNPDSLSQPVTHDDTSLSESETDVSSCDWEETSDSQLDETPLPNNKDVPVSDLECDAGNTPLSSECATSFEHDEHLQNRAGFQTGVKPFKCPICGKRYPQKISLTKHMKRHSEGTCFSCSVCKKSFPWRGELVRHMRIHTGEKPFSCSACGIRFSQRIHLTSHLRVHTGEKPFTCSVCQTSFSIRKNLGIHMRIHTGQKPFGCSVCGKRFARRGGLTRHSTVHTGEKAFSCSFCGERFAHLVTLKRHLTVHTGEKAFSCNVCGKRFARLQYLKKHKCVAESSTKK